MSLSILSTFVKWKFYELIFVTAHFQQLRAHGIVSSQFLVKWVPGNCHRFDTKQLAELIAWINATRLQGPKEEIHLNDFFRLFFIQENTFGYICTFSQWPTTYIVEFNQIVSEKPRNRFREPLKI